MLDIKEVLYENPMIMAIKDNKDLNECLKEDFDDHRVVFVLYGNLETIPQIVKKLKEKNKIVLVHENLIEGLASSHFSTTFIKKYTEADGIITTRAQNAYYARKIDLISVLRFFVIDSISYENIKETLKKASCDLIEILPGLMPKIIKDLSQRTNIPIVAGGLIKDKADVMDVLKSGGIAVSSSNYQIWNM